MQDLRDEELRTWSHQQMMNENKMKNDDKTPKTNESCEQTNAPWQFLEAQTRNSETNLERTTNWALITRRWRIVSDLEWKTSWTEMGINPRNGGRRLGIFAEREGITPLGGGSKISEEDPPLWVKDSQIRIGGSHEHLETWEKTQISNLHITQIWIQMCLTRAYILWAETQKGPT